MSATLSDRLQALKEIAWRLHECPTYMDREDLARYLDDQDLAGWAVRSFSEMRNFIDNVERLLRESSAD